MTNQRISDGVAIWIDHRIAIMVYFPNDRFQNGKNVWIEEGLNGQKQDHSIQHRNGHRQEALKHYYDNMINQLKHLVHVNDILILGPGQAKYELFHRIDHYKSLKGKIKNIQNAPCMSEQDLKAFANQYFTEWFKKNKGSH